MKQLFVFVVVLALLSMSVAAFGFPEIISGKVIIDGKTYDGVEPKITNVRTGQVFRPQTDAGGIYTVTVNEEFYPRDKFLVEVCTGDPACLKEVILPGGVPVRADFIISSNPVTGGPGVFWKGTTVVAGLMAVLFGILAGVQTNRKNSIMKSWVRELLQSAERVVIGKIRDIRADGELTPDFVALAEEYEVAHANRPKVLQALRG